MYQTEIYLEYTSGTQQDTTPHVSSCSVLRFDIHSSVNTDSTRGRASTSLIADYGPDKARLVAEAATRRGTPRRHPRWDEVAVPLFRLPYRATQYSRLTCAVRHHHCHRRRCHRLCHRRRRRRPHHDRVSRQRRFTGDIRGVRRSFRGWAVSG